MNAVVVDCLRAWFEKPGAPVLRGVTLSVSAEEVFGIVGPSGCGKSTLLRIIAGIYPRWMGRIEVLGAPLEPAAKLSKERRRAIQMVFQDPFASLHPYHTVARTLTEPLRVIGTHRPDAHARAALEEVGLSADIARRYPHELSGGQRQRVCIARALLSRPRLLLLDEPTSALDLSVQAEILNLLARLKVTHGITLLIVSHDAGVIAHLCDRAAIMSEGLVRGIVGRAVLDSLTPDDDIGAFFQSRAILRPSQVQV